MTGFLNMFKTTPAPTVAPAAPAPAPTNNAANPNTAVASGVQPVPDGSISNPPAVDTVNTPGTAANGVVPNNVNTPENPLDQFATLWETDPNAVKTENFTPEVLDQTKLQEVMSKVDMTAAVTPENLAAIKAGGDEAATALMSSLNSVAQQTLMQSTVISNKMIEQAVLKTQEAMTAQIPDILKAHNLTNSLQEQNPIYSNPAVAPVIDAVKSQLRLKNPNATTTELTTMAQEFVKTMAGALVPAAPATETPAGETDWSNFENG